MFWFWCCWCFSAVVVRHLIWINLAMRCLQLWTTIRSLHQLLQSDKWPKRQSEGPSHNSLISCSQQMSHKVEISKHFKHPWTELFQVQFFHYGRKNKSIWPKGRNGWHFNELHWCSIAVFEFSIIRLFLLYGSIYTLKFKMLNFCNISHFPAHLIMSLSVVSTLFSQHFFASFGAK